MKMSAELEARLGKPIKTYRDLLEVLPLLNKEQLNSDITIELEYMDECFPAEFRICSENHGSLDDGHPVIFTTHA